jgi:hypothetical protein
MAFRMAISALFGRPTVPWNFNPDAISPGNPLIIIKLVFYMFQMAFNVR